MAAAAEPGCGRDPTRIARRGRDGGGDPQRAGARRGRRARMRPASLLPRKPRHRRRQPDTAGSQREDANGTPLANADDRPRADDFESKILAMGGVSRRAAARGASSRVSQAPGGSPKSSGCDSRANPPVFYRVGQQDRRGRDHRQRRYPLLRGACVRPGAARLGGDVAVAEGIAGIRTVANSLV